MEITSNSINRIPLDQIVTHDTPQVLNIAQLNGNVSIETMKIYQFINGINVTKLDQESIKTFGEQFISSFLIFEEDLEVENLEVKERLNEIYVENYYLTTGDRIISEKSNFTDLQAANLNVHNNVEGNFMNINLKNFTKNRLTYSTPQNVIENATLENFESEKMNCKAQTYLCHVLLNDTKIMESLISKVSSGEIFIKGGILSFLCNVWYKYFPTFQSFLWRKT